MLLVLIFTVLAVQFATAKSIADKRSPELLGNASTTANKKLSSPPIKILQNNGLWPIETPSRQPMMWHSQTNSIIHPKVQFQVPAPGVIESTPTNSQRRCPLSPFAKFLTDGEQEALHELIVEARQNGADEPEIKEHINKYLKEILTAEKLQQFEEANAKFEKNRFMKRPCMNNEWRNQAETGLTPQEESNFQKSNPDNRKLLSKLIFKTR
uniref:SXP/RAL-2 family protein Ani s 5-like cation-binding domain-containing protein n=1 Tax=Syphacia muris TaxID=451379 RepID=A0A0N5AT42_9BILA